MRRLVVTIAALTAIPGAALAADMGMPLKASPRSAPALSWTGFYLGGRFGYGMYDNTTTTLGITAGLSGTSNWVAQ
jgi:opacity protein-like surface antigen